MVCHLVYELGAQLSSKELRSTQQPKLAQAVYPSRGRDHVRHIVAGQRDRPISAVRGDSDAVVTGSEVQPHVKRKDSATTISGDGGAGVIHDVLDVAGHLSAPVDGNADTIRQGDALQVDAIQSILLAHGRNPDALFIHRRRLRLSTYCRELYTRRRQDCFALCKIFSADDRHARRRRSECGAEPPTGVRGAHDRAKGVQAPPA